jgi:protein-S-isoprenylcysteine O-methyltransferase Ste14
MEKIIQFLLPLYFTIYFLFAFIIRSIQVYQRTGKNPMVLPKDDSAYGLIGFYFKGTLIGLLLYVFMFAWLPSLKAYFLPILLPLPEVWQWLGLLLLLVALIWTIVAQGNMKDSWRIGIDRDMKTALITAGLFSFTRNPIFLGMLLVLAGLFFLTPNAATLIFWIVGYILIQLQIRLEEEYLSRQHGEQYDEFCKKVPRRLLL